MQMLYDSDSFVVVHISSGAIVDGLVDKMDDAKRSHQLQLLSMQTLSTPVTNALHRATLLTPAQSSKDASEDNNDASLQDALDNHPSLSRHGFEIVDKRTGKQVYLDGSWAEVFQQQLVAWQINTPTQEEVEETLSGYAALAQNPVRIH